MTEIEYIDNEVPWTAQRPAGEWSAAQGPGTIARCVEAGWPDGRGMGLRQTGGDAYVARLWSPPHAIAPGGEFWLGFRQRINALPAADWQNASHLLTGSSSLFYLYILRESRPLGVVLCGATHYIDCPAQGQWHHFAVGIRRAAAANAADGRAEVWIDGARVVLADALANFATAERVSELRIGQWWGGSTAFSVDVDDVTIGDSRPIGDEAHWRVFRGVGRDVDYSAPVASLPDGDALSVKGLGHAAGTTYTYGLRRVSGSGVCEPNTHVRAAAAIAADGGLVPALARPTDLSLRPCGDGRMILGFTYRPLDGQDPPDTLEVFSDDGAGQFDLDAPLASLLVRPRQTNFQTDLDLPPTSVQLAVRAVASGAAGPLATIPIPRAAAPAPAQTF